MKKSKIEYFKAFAKLVKNGLSSLPYDCELEEVCDLIEKCCEYNNPLDWDELAELLEIK